MSGDKQHLIVDELQVKRSYELRCLAFIAVSLSTVAITACLFSLPMAFTFIQALQVEMDAEMVFCKIRTRELWKEMVTVSQEDGPTESAATVMARAFGLMKLVDPALDETELIRHPRQSYGGAPRPNPTYGRPSGGGDYGVRPGGGGGGTFRPTNEELFECCTCHRGSIGREGPQGRPGRPGNQGYNGRPGQNGRPAPPLVSNALLPQQCPCEADSGSPGRTGPKGAPGAPGNEGRPGQPGNPGEPGNEGPNGERGRPGDAGLKGRNGEGGRFETVKGPQGPPGPPGRGGGRGKNGTPGNPGRDAEPGNGGLPGGPGKPGRGGQPGPRGAPGEIGGYGEPGSCEHCPSARLAPGY